MSFFNTLVFLWSSPRRPDPGTPSGGSGTTPGIGGVYAPGVYETGVYVETSGGEPELNLGHLLLTESGDFVALTEGGDLVRLNELTPSRGSGGTILLTEGGDRLLLTEGGDALILLEI